MNDHPTSTPPTQEPGVVIEDESWRHGFTIVPNIILRTGDLSLGAKMTYAVLLSYAWGKETCYPSQELMAKDMGCNQKHVRAYLKELVDAGLVFVKKQGQGRPNLYRVPKLKDDPSRRLST